MIDIGSAVEPGDIQRTPGWFTLSQNYPNPFNASTSLHFELGKPSMVSMTIFNVQGERIRNIIENQQMLPGGYNVSWDGKNDQHIPVKSGVYFYHLETDNAKFSRKLVILR